MNNISKNLMIFLTICSELGGLVVTVTRQRNQTVNSILSMQSSRVVVTKRGEVYHGRSIDM